MKKYPKPWYRPSRKVWFVTLNGKQHKLGPDEEEALRKYHELMANPPSEHEEKPQLGPTDFVVELIGRFMRHVRVEAAEATTEWYRSRLQRFIDYLSDHGLHEVRVADLKCFHVHEWVNSYSGLSNGSKRNYCRAIQRCLRWSVDVGLIPHSPIANLKKPKGGRREDMVLTAEYEKLLQAIRNDNFRDLVIVTWETGARPQESLVVEARHVDLQNSRWVFPACESKTDFMRVVYLPEAALAITKKRMAAFSDGPIFRNSNGLPWTTDAVNCAFVALQIRLGKQLMTERCITIDEGELKQEITRLKAAIGRELSDAELRERARRRLERRIACRLVQKRSLYVLRHSQITRGLQNGVDSLTMATLSGHRDIRTTAIYAHLSHNPGHLLREAQRAAAKS